MSFKRVADDFDDFNLQRKRRVNDLLLDNMPSDEVILMANGKLACTVCHYRPVFDTTAMLSIHRNGKKHLANTLVKLEREKEDLQIKQRREHENYLKTDKSGEAPLLGITKLKKEIALSGSSQPTNDSLRSDSGMGHTNKPFFTTASKFNISGSPTEDSTESLRTNTDMGHTDKPFFTACSSQSTNNSTRPHSVHSYTGPANKPFFMATKTNPCDSKQTYQMANSKSSSSNRMHGSGVNAKDSRKDRFLSVNPLTKQKYTPQDTRLGLENDKPKCIPSTSEFNEHTKDNSNMDSVQVSACDQLDSKSRALYLSKLRQIGWIMGLDGKWTKDENAEFDSDEDEPPSPKTVLQG